MSSQEPINLTPFPELPNNTSGKGGGDGWVETRWVMRGKKRHGPYLYHCWREGGKRRCRYLGKGAVQIQTGGQPDTQPDPCESLKAVSPPLSSPK